MSSACSRCYSHIFSEDLLASVTMVSFTTASVVEKRNVHLPASLASYRAASARFINSSKDASFVANAIPIVAPMLAVVPVDSVYGSDTHLDIDSGSPAQG